MKGASCRKDYGKSLTFLLLGKPGIGKSTLVNGLVGKNVAEVSARGEITTEGVTKELTLYEIVIEDVTIRVWDTPGLLDPNIGTERTLNAVKRIFDEIDLFLFCVEMTTSRVFRDGDEKVMIHMISRILGEGFWNKAIIGLLKANLRIHQLSDELDTPEQVKAAYETSLKRWKKILGEMVPVRKVKVIPVGISKKPLLFPEDKSPWLSKFWRKVYNKLSDEKQLALATVTFDRLLVYSESHLKPVGETFRKPIKSLTKLINLTKKGAIVGDISADEDEVKSQVENLRSAINSLKISAFQGDFSIDEDGGSLESSSKVSGKTEQVTVPGSPSLENGHATLTLPMEQDTRQNLLTINNDSDHKLLGQDSEKKPQLPKEYADQKIAEVDSVSLLVDQEKTVRSLPSEVHPVNNDESVELPVKLLAASPNNTLPSGEAVSEKSDDVKSSAIPDEAMSTLQLSPSHLMLPCTSISEDVANSNRTTETSKDRSSEFTTSMNRVRSSTEPKCSINHSVVDQSSPTPSSGNVEGSINRFRSKTAADIAISPSRKPPKYTRPYEVKSEPSKKVYKEPQRPVTSISISTDQAERKIGRFNKDRFSFLNPTKNSEDPASRKQCPPPKRLVSKFIPVCQEEHSPTQSKSVKPGRINSARLDPRTYKSPFKVLSEDEHNKHSATNQGEHDEGQATNTFSPPLSKQSIQPIETSHSDNRTPPTGNTSPTIMLPALTPSQLVAASLSPSAEKSLVTSKCKDEKILGPQRSHQWELPSPALEATPTPDATLTPGATQTPDTTPTPGTTQTPDATPTPGATQTPDATQTQDATLTPDTTLTLNATLTTNTTPTLDATPIQDATQTPDTTLTPDAIPTLDATPTPEATLTPDATPTPYATLAPKATPTPPETGLEESYVVVRSLEKSFDDANEKSILKKKDEHVDTTAKLAKSAIGNKSQLIQETDKYGRIVCTSTMGDHITRLSGTKNPEDQRIFVSEGFFGKIKKTFQRILRKLF